MKKGFTLLEVVISIAALSLISVFILQMFMASYNVNNRAKSADHALAAAVSEIETVKRHKSLTEYIETSDAQKTIGETVTMTVYMDKSWNRITAAETGIPTDARFSVMIDIHAEHQRSEGLYQMEVNVAELTQGETGRILVTLQAKKYFSVGFEGGSHGN